MAASLDIRRTASADGVEIAFAVLGQGPLLVVIFPAHVSDLLLNWSVPVHRQGLQTLARYFTVAVIDLRGTGQSEREPRELTLDLLAGDVEAVMDALAQPSASILAMGNSSRIACYIAAKMPGRIKRLGLYGPGESEIARTLHALRQVNVGAQADMRASILGGLRDPRNTESLAAVFRDSITAATFERFAAAISAVDFDDVLRQVETPALFLHASHDQLIPLAASEAMASLMPNAAVRTYPGTSPLVMWRSRNAVQDMTRFFLGEDLSTDRRPRRAVTAGTHPSGLTEREDEILTRVANGKTNQQIAEELFISANTVRHHLKNIFLKTGVRNRTEAAAYASRPAAQ